MAIPAIGAILKAIGGVATKATTAVEATKVGGALIKGVKAVNNFKALAKGGLTKASVKLLQKAGLSESFIQGFNSTIDTIHKLSQSDLIGLLKKYTGEQRVIERYLKTVAEYNELVDREAIQRFLRGERVDELTRIVDKMPDNKKDILEAIKKFNYRKRSLKATGSNQTLRGFSDTMRAQGYDKLADYLDGLTDSRGKLRQLVNESIRTGELQEFLTEYWDSETGELLYEDEDGIIERLEEYFNEDNVNSFWESVVENRKLIKSLSDKKKAEIISKVRSRTPQQVAKAKAMAKKRGGRTKSK